MRSEGVLVYFAGAKGMFLNCSKGDVDFLSATNDFAAPARELFASSGFYKFVPKENFYPTIQDAVSIARRRQDS